MINRLLVSCVVALAFLPFLLLLKLNNKANLKKDIRCRQFFMPIVAVVYSLIVMVFTDKILKLVYMLLEWLIKLFRDVKLAFVANFIDGLVDKYAALVLLVLGNLVFAIVFIMLKTTVLAFFRKKEAEPSHDNKIVTCFYEYSDIKEKWFIKNKFSEGRNFLKVAYYTSIIVSMLSMMISCSLYLKKDLMYPYYPVFGIIVIGEVAFFLSGLRKDELPSGLTVDSENATHNAFYFLLRKTLKNLFGDKLSADGTTVNNYGSFAESVEDVLADMDTTGGHVGKNYYEFIKQKEVRGLKPNPDYVKSGYDLAVGKSLLFNTPFYYKLIPYIFYAMNRTLLDEGKVLIVLGRHGTTDDLRHWCEEGLFSVSNIPDVWTIEELDEDETKIEMPDVGIITRSGVHNMNLQHVNKDFLSKVRFVFLVEPSRLVTTAQVGLSLLVRCFDQNENVVYCSVDKNCDGLLDSLSHILSANLTEVSPTEYAHGVNSYMCWLSDKEYIQHRILSGVSRYLGMGTELSFVALKNQVENAIWFGGDAYPVIDQYWISKQYYHSLLKYAELPTAQEAFNHYFNVSYNLCNERVRDNAYITVEDEQSNLFEIKRIFATIAEEQSFVNVISSEYMLREYMARNDNLFNTDPKAIPYVVADFARTKRNVLLVLCLRLSIEGVTQAKLQAELELIGVAVSDLADNVSSPLRAAAFWNELCQILENPDKENVDAFGNYIIEKEIVGKDEKMVFKKDDVLFVRRTYNENSGKFENIFVIDNRDFQKYILQDLAHARYVAEQDREEQYLGTELVGHVLQKYLPGQLLTLNGKYYEMLSIVRENQILLRRASEHIKGRLSYRQERHYVFEKVKDSDDFGALKTVNNIDIYYQNADFYVDTPAYWVMDAYNDFETALKVSISNIPRRCYFNKQILKIDFSKYKEAFNDKIKATITVLINETLRTMYAENQAYISAVTYLDNTDDITPLTFSITSEDERFSKSAIYIIEDSQLDIGLLVSVERNLQRILQIVSDYLAWNTEMIELSISQENKKSEKSEEPDDTASKPEEEQKDKKKKKKTCFLSSLFSRKKKKEQSSEHSTENESETPSTESEKSKTIDKSELRAKKIAEKRALKAQHKAEKEALKQLKKKKKQQNADNSSDMPVEDNDSSKSNDLPDTETLNNDSEEEKEETPEVSQYVTTDENVNVENEKEEDDG